MRNTIIVTVLLFIAVIGASIYYFSDLNQDHKDAVKPLKFLPKETYLISSFKNDETTDNIFKDFEIFDALLGKKETGEIRKLKNVLLRSASIQPYTLNEEIYISLHPEDKEIKSVFIIPFSAGLKKEELSTLFSGLSKQFRVSKQDTLGKTIYAFDEGKKDTVLYAAYDHQIVFASYSKKLITTILDDKVVKMDQHQIDFFIKHNSKNSPMSVYFDHRQINPIAKQLTNRRSGFYVNMFADLRGESAWNINYKNDALMLVGESEITNDSSYLTVFASQSKTDQTLYNYFPANTATYIEYSISDIASFGEKLMKFFEKKDDVKKYNNHIRNIESNTKLTYAKDMRQIWGTDFATAELDNGDLLGFVQIADSVSFSKTISRLSKALGDSIYQLDFSNTLYFAFGDAFKQFQRPYFTIIDKRTLVFANSQSNLQEYLRSWNAQRLLTGTLGFKNFEKLQGNKANVTFFLHSKNASGIIANSLASSYLKNYREKENFGFQDFYSWSIQLGGNNGSFQSSIYGIYKSKNALGGTPDWTYQFDGKLIGQPWVFEHSDTSKMILAQEQNHTIHAIHPKGTKLWSAVLSGRVIGSPIQLPDRSIVLVTDNRRLYRFDTSGKVHKGFSLGIPQQANDGPSVANFDNNMLLIPAGNTILAYDLEGKSLANWKNVDLDGELLFDIKTIHFKNTDYLITSTKTGSVYFIGKNGETIKKVQNPTGSSFRNPIHITASADGNDLLVMATDAGGNLVTFSLNGDAKSRKIGDWSSEYYADIRNITADSKADVIIIDKNKLAVYSTTDTTMYFQYTFTRDIEERPLFFPLEKDRFTLGIGSRNNYLIGLFNENGNLMEGFPLEALPNFYFGKINYAGGNFLLCTKRDHKLYAFPF
ncbi:hypothetical protein ACR79P_12890 [Sphingobacterium spiritivorum]|uniref:hypothetical protein n=1 Tax=Sphingobacterium spiritivorum TaxID=258 RepID=UPI003DA2F9BA